VELKIRGDSTPAAGTGYAAGDFYKYTKVLALDANSETKASSVELTSANEVNTTSNANTFNNIWAPHVSDAADGLMLQIL
jgi:hypothetical protein